jgi:hypothetical protein
VVDVKREHPHVTPASKPVTNDAWVTDRDDITIVGKRNRQLGTGSVGTHLLREFPHRFRRFGRCGHVGAQPPQRPGERVTFDDSTARHNEAG